MNGAGQGLARRYEAGRALIRQQNEDCRRGEFLRAIDCSATAVSDFEMNFIAGFLGARALLKLELDFQWFTLRRREVVDSMIKRYGFRSLNPQLSAPRIPQAEPGHCGYLKREDGRRNIPCNQPAVVKLPGGLELCAACHQIRNDVIEKMRQFKTRQLRS